MRALVAGIDAGGTGVRIRLVDAASHEPIDEREAPSDPALGPTPALALVAPHRPVAVCAGFAGYTRPDVLAAWRKGFADALPDAAVRLEPDFAIAFHGALSGRDGVAVLAGTGAVACGQREGGFVRVGGRGWEYGDEGSGGFLTTELVRRAVRAADGLLPATPLTEAVAERLGARDAAEIAAAARARAAAEGRGFLVPWIAERADAGDSEAANLFVGAAGWLGRLLWTAAERLGFGADDPIPVAQVGGLWQVGPALTGPFAAVVRRRFPHAVLQPPDGAPVDGAVRLALATWQAPT